MKNLFLFFFISFTSFSQINEGDLNGGDFVSNYMSFFNTIVLIKLIFPMKIVILMRERFFLVLILMVNGLKWM